MTKYRIDREAKQRPTGSSSYPAITWKVIRVADGHVVCKCASKKEAQRAIDLIEGR